MIFDDHRKNCVAALHKHFIQFGPLLTINPNPKEGYAYVEFADRSAAERAEQNGFFGCKFSLIVPKWDPNFIVSSEQLARARPDEKKELRLKLGAQLKKLFAAYNAPDVTAEKKQSLQALMSRINTRITEIKNAK